MSADNFFVVKPHPLGGFTYVQGFAADGDWEDDDGNIVGAPPLVAAESHPQFPTVAKALRAAMQEYSEYGVSVAASCGNWADEQAWT